MIQFLDNTLPLAVIVSRTPWHEPPRMRHFIAQQMERFFNVLYIKVPNPAVVGDESDVQVSQRLWTYSLSNKEPLPARIYCNYPYSHHKWNQNLAAKIEALVARLNSNKKILANFIFDFPEIMRIDGFSYKLYICNDEFPKATLGKDRHQFFRQFYQVPLLQFYENQVAANADVCLATHQPLVNKLSKVNKKTELFVHGHSFTPVMSQSVTRQNNKLIKVAFMGFINDRLLHDWLSEIVKQPDMELYMAGPKETKKEDVFSKHAQAPNLKYSGLIPHDKLYDYLRQMDILVSVNDAKLPDDALITTNSKTFQYIAALKPIVMSYMPNYIRMPEGVFYNAHSPEEFIAKIRQAYNEDCDDFRKLRYRIANANTWDQRGNHLYEIIRREIE